MAKKILIGIASVLIVGFGLYFFASRITVTIHVSRTFNAPVERVWALWTNEDSMKKWWGPKHYSAPIIKNDVRVNGFFLFSMKAPNGETHYNSGMYTDISLNKKIVAKMFFSDENGSPIPASQVGVPGQWPEHVEIEVTFSEMDGGTKTRVQVTETGIPLVMSTFAKLGWEQQLDKFDLMLK